MPTSLVEPRDDAVALIPVTSASYPEWLAAQPPSVGRWLSGLGWKPSAGAVAALPSEDGTPAAMVVGVDDPPGFWALSGLPWTLPAGTYRLDRPADGRPLLAPDRAAAGWAIGAYRFGRYSRGDREPASLVWPEGADRGRVAATVEAHLLVRDLINTPANDMGPEELEAASRTVAEARGAEISVIRGDDLLAANYPLVHAVGRASARAPRLIELRWGDPGAPLVAVLGKGVCFDSGGLDLKTSAGMLLMKKDMGGGAHALALARMIMETRLPVRLRVLVPAVENFVAANSFRPLDIYPSRKGLAVEITNTDAEGRLILADALTAAGEESPAVIVDFATLTGAARVALGPELPAFFTNDEGWASEVAAAALAEDDPVWRLPLHPSYRRLLKSTTGDIVNAPEGGMAGAITAALFLERFVPEGTPWMHLDVYGWNMAARPGRPRGGEAMGLRAVFAALERRFGG